MIFPADADDDAGDPVISAEAELPAGGNVSLVAHLTEDGKPTLTPFVDDVSDVPAGKSRIVVRHTAAAPAVDVLAGDTAVIEDITNPDEKALEVAAGTIAAAAAAGTTDPVIGPADLDLEEGTATSVHAVCSLDDDTLGFVIFTIKCLASAPPASRRVRRPVPRPTRSCRSRSCCRVRWVSVPPA